MLVLNVFAGGLASCAIAAIDIALWDLTGETLGRSLLDLLGRAAHDRLLAIASVHAQHDSIAAMAAGPGMPRAANWPIHAAVWLIGSYLAWPQRPAARRSNLPAAPERTLS